MTLTTENLGKRFNHEWIFRNFNYSFHNGVYAVTGPNGSGKSTLLQVLWGQIPVSAGAITYSVQGKNIPIEDIYQHMAIATPYMDLIEEFTLIETLKFHFSFKRIRGSRTVEEVLDLLELGHARNKRISHFSSGMKQRLKLGLAFYSDVEAVFLDEPMTNLDKSAVAWYWQNFALIADNSLVFIGTNLENEYPSNSTKINLLDHK